MTDPYKVLGLDPSASDEQIKSSYRSLAQKYTSGEYTVGPLNEVAEQKYSELNEAFDAIMSARRLGGQADASGSQSASGGYTNGYTNSSSLMDEVRELLRQNNVTAAEQRLLNVPSSSRSAEWYFLMGDVCRSKGWIDEAFNYYGKAAEMDPGNTEYSSVYESLKNQRSTGYSYNPYTNTKRDTGTAFGMNDECCDLCQCLCLASACQNCCCGR